MHFRVRYFEIFGPGVARVQSFRLLGRYVSRTCAVSNPGCGHHTCGMRGFRGRDSDCDGDARRACPDFRRFYSFSWNFEGYSNSNCNFYCCLFSFVFPHISAVHGIENLTVLIKSKVFYQLICQPYITLIE